MASTVFTDFVTPVPAAWLNDVNAATYTALPAEVARATAAEALKAPIASPVFTGTPSLPTGTTAVTQAAGNNTTAVATTAFTISEIGTLKLNPLATWQTVTRTVNTTYTSPNYHIVLAWTNAQISPVVSSTVIVGGVSIAISYGYGPIIVPIPPNTTYMVSSTTGASMFAELR